MDDFLYNLRKSVEERSKSGNRHGDGNSHRGGDRRCGMDRRNRKPQKHHNDRRNYPHYNRNLHEIRVLLEKLLEQQGQQRALEEKRLVFEERRTAAMERIAGCLGRSLGTPAVVDTESAMITPEAIDTIPEAVEKRDHGSPEPATAGELMTALRAQGKSYEKIAKALEASGFPTVSGRGRWRGQTVKRELAKLGVDG